MSEQNQLSTTSKLVYVQVVGGTEQDIKSISEFLGKVLFDDHGIHAIVSNELISLKSVEELVKDLQKVVKDEKKKK